MSRNHTEHQALTLIAKIEDHKLESLKSLTEITKSRVRQAALTLERLGLTTSLTIATRDLFNGLTGDSGSSIL